VEVEYVDVSPNHTRDDAAVALVQVVVATVVPALTLTELSVGSFDVVMEMALEVATLPEGSRATATTVFESEEVAVESHDMEYGEEVSSLPCKIPFT